MKRYYLGVWIAMTVWPGGCGEAEADSGSAGSW